MLQMRPVGKGRSSAFALDPSRFIVGGQTCEGDCPRTSRMASLSLVL